MKKKLIFLGILVPLILSGCRKEDATSSTSTNNYTTTVISTSSTIACASGLYYKDNATPPVLSENDNYEKKVDIAGYLRSYHKLPYNYITKDQKENGSYNNTEYNIGGTYFGNYEKILPNNSAYAYIECDIESTLSNRGVKRIVYNTVSWKIFYTDDHYASFQEYLGYNNWGPKFGGSYGNHKAPCNTSGYVF